jgi:hypothetical protein
VLTALIVDRTGSEVGWHLLSSYPEVTYSGKSRFATAHEAEVAEVTMRYVSLKNTSRPIAKRDLYHARHGLDYCCCEGCATRLMWQRSINEFDGEFA